jgi:hypothetical protein
MLLLAFGLFALLDVRMLLGVSVWVKPMKFAISICLYTWTMAWFLAYLRDNRLKNAAAWLIVITMIVETLCIAGQAARGVKSHFNIATPFDDIVFGIMGFAISMNTIAVGMVVYLFFRKSFAPTFQDSLQSQPAYTLAIRFGLFIFIIASVEGFLMAARLKHSVGGADGSIGLPFVNWSRSIGDLRVAHFFGLHALQVLPLFAFLVVRRFSQKESMIAVIVASCLYVGLCVTALLQALAGKPFV